MRRPWIKIETATPDKPEVCAISTTLRMDEDAVLGKLVRLWSWVEVNRVPANDLGVTKEFIDKLVGRKGFAAALASCGWLVVEEGRLGLKNLNRHNGGLAKVRALTAQRVALHRKRKQLLAAPSVSEALHDAPVKTEDFSTESPDQDRLEDVGNDNNENRNNEIDSIVDQATEGASKSAETSDTPEPLVPEALVERSHGSEPEETVEEPTSSKRRSRSSVESPDQPLLF